MIFLFTGTSVPAQANRPKSIAKGPRIHIPNSGGQIEEFVLSLNEMEMKLPRTTELDGPSEQPSARPRLIKGATVTRQSGSWTVIRLSGIRNREEFQRAAGKLRSANPNAEIFFVLTKFRRPGGPPLRFRLSREVLFSLTAGASLPSVLGVKLQEQARPLRDNPAIFSVHLEDPLAAVRVASALRQLEKVQLSYVVILPGTAGPAEPQLARNEAGRSLPNSYTEAAAALEFYSQKRARPGETAIPFEKYREALEHMKDMPQFSTPGNTFQPSRREMEVGIENSTHPEVQANTVLGTWNPLGPGNIGGRTRAILIHPTSPSTMYAAGVAGGVWKTTNAGGTWTPLTDDMANLAVASMAMDPANPNVIYAGTGEGFFNLDAVRGAGIFKTTDGGANWTQLANTINSNFHYVMDIVVSTGNSSRVYAATRSGVYRSTDGGLNWTQVLNHGGGEGCTDLAIRTDLATDTVFAACGVFNQGFVYRNTDAGGSGTWSVVLTEGGMGRTTLAIAKSNQSVIYALSATNSSSSTLHAVFRSTTGGASGSWTAQVRNTASVLLNTWLLSYAYFASSTCSGANAFNLGQGWYANTIAVDPSDSNRVWVGGIDLFRSDDGGVNWGIASYWFAPKTHDAYVHADQHAIVFHPQFDGNANKVVYVGNDGGIFRSDDARAATATGANAPCNHVNTSVKWTGLNNNYAVTQFYHGLPYPGGTTYFGGTQDNGTVRGSDAAGANGWVEIDGGDGGYVAVDPNNTNVLYAEYVRGAIKKTTTGQPPFVSATSGIFGVGSPSSFLFIAPFIMDPNNSQTLWAGGSVLWRTTNGAASWTQASASMPALVSALAIANGNSNTMVVGTSSGHILRNTAALSATSGSIWALAQPRSGYVSWVAFDPANANTVYATYSTFGGVHVWKSTDGGVSWASIDGSGMTRVPDIPVHVIVVDPGNSSRLYIGTDLGVFVSNDGGANWAVENTGFANVVTESLAITQVNGTPNLFAFTHGRGAYRTVIPATSGNPTPAITSINPSSASAGSAGFTLTVNGSNFLSSSTVRWNGSNRTTTFVNSTQLTAAILTSDLTAAGTAQVTVFNAAPGGGTSNSVSFSINAVTVVNNDNFVNAIQASPTPFTHSVNTSGATTETGDPTPTCGNSSRGKSVWYKFTPSSNGVTTADTFGSNYDTILSVYTGSPGSFVSVACNDDTSSAQSQVAFNGVSGTQYFFLVTDYNSAGGALTFNLIFGNPIPSISTIQPTSASAGSGALTLTVNGSGFVSTSVVQWNGSARTTTFVNSTQLTATITASDLASAGTAQVTVMSPAPGGGTSSAVPFTIQPAGQILNADFESGSQGFVAASVAGSLTWQITTNRGNDAGHSPTHSFYFGNPATMNYDTGVREAATLTSGPIVLGSAPIDLSFKYFLATENINGFDVLQVQVSNNNGVSFVTLANNQSGGLLVNNSGIWQSVTLSLSAFAGQTIQLRFFFDTVDHINNIPEGAYIDDVIIQGTVAAGAAPNDNFANAITISAQTFTHNTNTSTATTETQDPTPLCGNGSRGRSVWYKYTAPSSGSVVADTFGSSYDTILSVYTGSPGSFVSIACNDDFASLQSQVSFNVSAGITYFFMVSAYISDGGPTTFHFVTNNPVPVANTLVPSTAPAQGSGFSLTVSGAGFVSNSVVRWNGANRTTVFVSGTQLTASIPASDIASAGTAQVTVFNPAPGGGTSNALSFVISSPVVLNNDNFANALVVSASPFSHTADTSAATVETADPIPNCGNGSRARSVWYRFTPGVSGTLTVDTFASNYDTILSVYTGTAGNLTQIACNDDFGVIQGSFVLQSQVTINVNSGVQYHFMVTSYSGFGGTLIFNLGQNNPVPVIATLTPANASVGTNGITLTVDGSGFVANSVVRWNGANRTTTFVNATQVTATIPAGDLANVGTAQVTVFNPTPGGGESNSVQFTISSGSASFSADFESGVQGFVPANAVNSLTWQLTTNRGNDANHSPTHSFYFGNPTASNYDTGLREGATLTSPSISLGSAPISLTFKYFMLTENLAGFDILRVQISNDDGATFVDVADNTGAFPVLLLETPNGWQQATIFLNAFANQTIRLRFFFDTIDNLFNNYEGVYIDDVLIQSSAAAANAPNDNFANAISITNSTFSQSVNTLNATTETLDPTPPCGNGSRGKSVWYRLTALGAGQVTIDTFGSNYDTILSVYTGTQGSFTPVVCNDDAGAGLQSQVVFQAVSGTTYHIMVSDWDSIGGTLIFNLNSSLATSRVLTVSSANPAGGVAITVTPADINAQGNGTTQFTRLYNQGAQVTLTAPATSGVNNFAAWSGCDSGSGTTCVVTMNSDRQVIANYITVRTLTVLSSAPSSGAAITVSPADLNNQSNGSTQFLRQYNHGTAVTLTASSFAAGNAFAFWQGCDSTVGVQCTVNMNSDRTVTATYQAGVGLSVQVIGLNNVAISGASVSIGGGTPQTTPTTGSLTFSLSPAVYDVQISLSGFRTVSLTVGVASSGTTSIIVRMVPANTGSSTTTSVAASQGWVNAGQVVAGNRYIFYAAGRWTANPQMSLYGPDGPTPSSGCPQTCALPTVTQGLLVARINNGPAFPISNTRLFTATATGNLQYAINDEQAVLFDNLGNVNVNTIAVPVTSSKTTGNDFDSDGKTDITVFRPSSGQWFSLRSGTPGPALTATWGAATDKLVPGDYDGDGKSDIAVWRPSTGFWFIFLSGSPGTSKAAQWGQPTDIPVPGDYDGDGITDFAVYRPSNGFWFVLRSSNNLAMSAQWGAPTDIPVPGDYDGDGKWDFTVFRPSTGHWFSLKSGTPGAVQFATWGVSTDIPVPGDYDGDGKTDFAVFRPSNGFWFILPSGAPGTTKTAQWGNATDIPLIGDFDGDGKTDITVFRPSNGFWFVLTSQFNSVLSFQWGASSDIPLPRAPGSP